MKSSWSPSEAHGHHFELKLSLEAGECSMLLVLFVYCQLEKAELEIEGGVAALAAGKI